MASTVTNPSTPSNAVSGSLLPLIPFQPLLSISPATPEVAQALLTAFHTSGFFYLTDYSSLISHSLVERVFKHSARFFARPQAQKDELEWTSPRANRGYTCMGREKVSQGLTQNDVAKDRESKGEDLKESFEIGREGEEGYPNQWPAEDEDAVIFKETMLEFFEQCRIAHAVVLRGIAIGMGLDAEFFDEYVKQGDNTLRLLHYPPVGPAGFEGGRVRAGAHSDYGSVTLLFQDERGGLQVEHPGGGAWLDVEPMEATIVVNAGDLLARWSNDQIRSTKHRVVQPPHKGSDSEEGHSSRFSVAYFCNPDFDRVIEALPGTWERDGQRYDAINSGDYLVQRLDATY